MADVKVKAGLATRMPLSQRLAKEKPSEERPAIIASMHNPLETTYDIDYSQLADAGVGGITQHTVSSGSNRFIPKGGFAAAASRNSALAAYETRRDGSYSAFHPGSHGADADAAMECAFGSPGLPVAVDASVGATGDTSGAATAAAALPYRVVSFPTSAWESEAHGATREVDPNRPRDFYARVRKEEQVDDDGRGGLVGASQRTVQIRQKRSTAPHMCPPAPDFRPVDPVEMPLVAAQNKGLIRRNYLDLVECEHTNPDTEQQLAYDDAPEHRLSGKDITWDIRTQTKAITHLATTEEMYRGTDKSIDHLPPGYGGHVPFAARNVDAMNGPDDARRRFAKAHMTLAVHGGGVDASVTSGSLRARGRRGKSAPAAKVLTPKTDEMIQQTVEGYMLMQTMTQINDRERTMNIRCDNQAENYF